MLKVILPSWQSIMPFNERARDLRLQNKPLWLYQRDTLAPYVDHEMELMLGQDLPPTDEDLLVYRDNLLFDTEFIEAFLSEAKKHNKPSRVAFSLNDKAFKEHCLPLSFSYTRAGDLYLADL
jgi:UDP-N-acetylglucosamine diphosphorylase / glucose-1-phosphate thymidylyltransferase / UDP-N-acetylgalactosamine diphosphorylase / glucosamine-1-phosphate N-acetyltransferase / galactosamine-1-phosphate N-acetyltransferase